LRCREDWTNRAFTKHSPLCVGLFVAVLDLGVAAQDVQLRQDVQLEWRRKTYSWNSADATDDPNTENHKSLYPRCLGQRNASRDIKIDKKAVTEIWISIKRPELGQEIKNCRLRIGPV